MILLSELYEQVLSEAFSSNADTIRKVIQQRRVVTFYYMGDKENAPGWRTVEPVCFGQGMKKFPHTYQRYYIRAWQRKGKTLSIVPGWKFFRMDRIRNWNIGTGVFNTIHPKFNPKGDKTMWRVIEIAQFGPPPQQPQPQATA